VERPGELGAAVRSVEQDLFLEPTVVLVSREPLCWARPNGYCMAAAKIATETRRNRFGCR
jgi:hypothetical protein